MITNYLFLTGGVASSLGKGITSASLAALLKSRGLNVSMLKLDPYINVDPGTINPVQHGEIFVTEDGAETDLDLGYYERFLMERMHAKNSASAGSVYSEVLEKERRGAYLGATVQVIPHVTNAIKDRIHEAAEGVQLLIVEVGGTVGDIESLPFLEAIRQFAIDVGRRHVLFLHMTLLPYLSNANEVKTKPTQHSVKALLSVGIQPDLLFCRATVDIPDTERKKIALFCNVDAQAVIALPDVEYIYSIPKLLQGQGVDEFICKHLNLSTVPSNIQIWDEIVRHQIAAAARGTPVKVAIVGKYTALPDAYRSVQEALLHASLQHAVNLEVVFIHAEKLEHYPSSIKEELEACAAILVPGGFGMRGIAGKLSAIEYARKHHIPFLGICLGLQLAVIEFARNVLGILSATSTEFEPNTPNPLIGLITEWANQGGLKEYRSQDAPLGGTMRLGSQPCALKPGSLIAQIYQQEVVYERHRHRYEVNNTYVEQLEAAGLLVSGRSADRLLVEVVELTSHPWFLAVQFHPEFTSNPRDGHPLFAAFIQAAQEYHNHQISTAHKQ